MDNQFYGGQGNGNQYGMMPPPAPVQEKGKGVGFAVAAFIIALVNLVFCAGVFSIIAVPLSLVFAIVSLASHRRGKAFAIISIVVSVLSSVVFGFYVMFYVKIMPDIVYFSNHYQEIVDEYNATGEIPEKFEKYEDPKFDKYWSAMGYDDFDAFFADFINGEISGMEVTTDGSRNGVHITPPTTEYYDDSSSSDEIPTDESGERLVDLCY